MIGAKNDEKLSQFVKVTAKILCRSLFPDTVYYYASQLQQYCELK